MFLLHPFRGPGFPGDSPLSQLLLCAEKGRLLTANSKPGASVYERGDGVLRPSMAYPNPISSSWIPPALPAFEPGT